MPNTYATGTSSDHPVSSTCKGEQCRICGQPATHKVGEEIPFDDPFVNRHNFIAYVCCEDFAVIFGQHAHGVLKPGPRIGIRWQSFRDFWQLVKSW